MFLGFFCYFKDNSTLTTARHTFSSRSEEANEDPWAIYTAQVSPLFSLEDPLTPFHSHPRTYLGTTSYLKRKAAICGQFHQLYDTKMQQAFNDRKGAILLY